MKELFKGLIMGKIRIGIHKDIVFRKDFVESYSKKWTKFLLEQNAEVIQLDLLSKEGFEKALSCDGVMWRYLHIPDHNQVAPQILNTLEMFNEINVYPNTRMSLHFDDKVMQTYILKSLNVSTPETWIFWDQESAVTWAQGATYPIVFKLRNGASSINVVRIETEDDALEYIKIMFSRGIFPRKTKLREIDNSFKLRTIFSRILDGGKYILKDKMPPPPTWDWKVERNYAYIQEYIPNNTYDTRITIIGNRAFAYRRFNKPNDFRASGSELIDVSPEEIDIRCVKIAFEVSQNGGFDCMAYDFLYKNSKPVVTEISYAFGGKTIITCPGHWDNKLNWVNGKMRAEEAQVLDFLAKIRKRKNKK